MRGNTKCSCAGQLWSGSVTLGSSVTPLRWNTLTDWFVNWLIYVVQLCIILQGDCGAGTPLSYSDVLGSNLSLEAGYGHGFRCLKSLSTQMPDYFCFLTRHLQISTDNSIIWLYIIWHITDVYKYTILTALLPRRCRLQLLSELRHGICTKLHDFIFQVIEFLYSLPWEPQTVHK
jgi:hypothetical protein